MKNKPKLKIIGKDGNAFSILGEAKKVAKKDGWTSFEINEFMRNAISGDYNNLLRIISENFNVE